MPLPPYNNYLKKYSRKLRTESTDTENILWCHLRCKRLLDIQFYRQKPLGPYIVDFYAPSVNLVIEIDGGQHFEDGEVEQDEMRDEFLKSLDLTVLRFNNNQVNHALYDVLESIYIYVQDKIPR